MNGNMKESLTYHISVNRYSMPVTRSRNGFEPNIDQTNTARFLFGDEDPTIWSRRNTPDNSFPMLVRRDGQIVSETIFIPTFLAQSLGRNMVHCFSHADVTFKRAAPR